MKIASKLLIAALLAGMLVSCASSTMDSVPTVLQLAAYEKVIRARHEGDFAELEKQHAAGRISQAEYVGRKQQIDAKIAEAVNDAAWNKHFLAESERKANGVPTPDAPVLLQPGRSVGGSMGSFYRPSSQNFGQVTGQSGVAGMGSMQNANQQVGNVQNIRNDALSAGGTYLSRPAPGSIYDDTARR